MADPHTERLRAVPARPSEVRDEEVPVAAGDKDLDRSNMRRATDAAGEPWHRRGGRGCRQDSGESGENEEQSALMLDEPTSPGLVEECGKRDASRRGTLAAADA